MQSLWSRYWPKVVETPSGCWQWKAGLDKDGYGRIGNGGRTFAAHRVSYRWWKGPIPSWLQVDHLCRNRACVNPAHLETVTGKVNIQRGDTGKAVAERNRARWSPTHCPHGHEYIPDNTIIQSNNSRRCRACQNERNAAWRKQRKAAAA